MQLICSQDNHGCGRRLHLHSQSSFHESIRLLRHVFFSGGGGLDLVSSTGLVSVAMVTTVQKSKIPLGG